MDREVLWKAHTHRDWPTPIGLCHQPVSSCNGSLQVAEERCKVERERQRERERLWPVACPTKQPKTHTQVWLSEPLTSSSLLSWLLPAACQMIINSTPPKHTQAATPELHLSSAAVGLWPVQPVQTFDLQCMFHVGGFPTAPSCTHSICAVKPLTCSLVSWVATDAACGPPSPVAPAELAGSAALAGGPCCPGLPSPVPLVNLALVDHPALVTLVHLALVLAHLALVPL